MYFSSSSGLNISSIVQEKSAASLNANGRRGSYLPVHTALTVWRETFRRPASLACDQSRSLLALKDGYNIYTITVGFARNFSGSSHINLRK
jgi:hypothetical protein